MAGRSGLKAGELMGQDFVEFPPDTTVGLALSAVRNSARIRPEALSVLFCVDGDGSLTGTLSLTEAIQLPPDTLLLDVCDPHPVVGDPGDYAADLLARMAGTQLGVLPVLDEQRRILGVVTLEDLVAAVPAHLGRHAAAPEDDTTR